MKKRTERILKQIIYELLMIIGAINIGVGLKYYLSIWVGVGAVILAVIFHSIWSNKK